MPHLDEGQPAFCDSPSCLFCQPPVQRRTMTMNPNQVSRFFPMQAPAVQAPAIQAPAMPALPHTPESLNFETLEEICPGFYFFGTVPVPPTPVRQPTNLPPTNISNFFGGLSLRDQEDPFTDSNVRLRTLQDDSPRDITIIYDRGQSTLKVHKVLLCSQSQWFDNALGGPLKESGPTTLHLRGDFPYAIQAMIDFVYTDTYSFYALARDLETRFPNTTALDFHVLVYMTATKYAVPRLRDHAIACYENMSRIIVARDFQHLYASQLAGVKTRGEELPARNPFPEHDKSAVADVFRWVNSLTLLWKNTRKGDEMRVAVLDVIKEYIVKLATCDDFVMLLVGNPGFADDVVEVLAEEGLELWARESRSGEHGLVFE